MAWVIMDLIRMLLPCLRDDVITMLNETKYHLLRIKLFDLVGVKCDFHYHRSGEYKHAALSICNADTQSAVCRRFQLYAVLKIIIYEGLD